MLGKCDNCKSVSVRLKKTSCELCALTAFLMYSAMMTQPESETNISLPRVTHIYIQRVASLCKHNHYRKITPRFIFNSQKGYT